MSKDIGSIKFHLYSLSKCKDREEVEYYISARMTELGDYSNYEDIDNILYSLDLSKINADIAYLILYNTKAYKENLSMRNYFIDAVKEKFPYNIESFKNVK